MAQCSSQLSSAEISKVTDIISADNRFRFCAEYLGINRNTYRTIESDKRFIHHDTLFCCIELWMNKKGEGLDAREDLIELLTRIQKDKGWFSKQEMAFLFDGEAVRLSVKRRYLS